MPAPVLQFKRGNAGVAGTVPALRPGEPAISLNNFDFFIGIDTSVANNKFFGSHRYWGREDGTNSLKLKLVDKDGTNYVSIKSPDTLAGIVTYQLPGVQGATSSVLTNDGSGNLTWSSGSANPVFTGIATFSDTTDNTLGLYNTGSVQIEGGLGVQKNVTVGAGLSVAGQSYFIGTATFYGGTLNLGDSDTDDIVVAGEFKSNLIPSDDATYNLGNGAKRWKNASFSGIGTFDNGIDANNVVIGISGANTIDTSVGKLSLSSANGSVEVTNRLDILGDLDVSGNVYIGGTTVTLRGTDVFIENKDIVLGYTTTTQPNDTTANHAGVAIASTEGTPLVPFSVSGINTLPDTYKQMMWFRSGTLGFATDAFAFNYGVAIGTTTMADGVRLAVGSGVTVSDTSVSATTFYGTLVGAVTGNASSADQVKTVTSLDTDSTYYVTFVNSNNGSADNETIYTDDGIHYNPSSNTFGSRHANFTGIVSATGLTVSGIATVASLNVTENVTLGDTSGDTITVKGTPIFEQIIIGTATTAIRAEGIDVVAVATNQNYYITLVDSSGNAKSVGVDSELLYNPNTNTFKVGTGVGITQFSSSVGSGTSTSSVPTSSAVIEYVRNSDFGLIGDSGSGSVNMDHSLSILGTANEIETSVSGQTVTIGIPNDVIVGTSLSSPTIRTNIIQSQNTGATVLTLTSDDAQVSGDLTVSGNLYVNGSTTQVNTSSLTVEDRTIELGIVDGAAPSSTTTWDLGVLFNYFQTSAKKSAVIWEQADARFKFGSEVSDGGGTDANSPQITFTSFAPIEIGALWVNDCAGQSQVISCTGTERFLENITVDAGTF